MNKIINFNNATLLVALSLSVVAEYYSIIGLATIFAGSPISAMVMGAILGIAKITALVWLRKYWHIATLTLKLYLVSAVIILATLTSTGIFGYLSKAHSSSSLPGGEMQSQVQLIDDKITNEKEIVKSAKDALAQLDSQVNNFIAKGDTERSAERSVQIRKQQQPERKQLQKEIETSNSKIAKLIEERTPIAGQLRNFEAEIGPIKYIAALIYGDNPDQNVLEKSVRWMIILLVAVFDPLAIALVLAANHSKAYEQNKPKIIAEQKEPDVTEINHILKEAESAKEIFEPELVAEPIEPELNLDLINQALNDASEITSRVSVIEPEIKTFEQTHYKINHPELRVYNIECEPVSLPVTATEPEPVEEIASAEAPIQPKLKSYSELGGDYVQFEGKRMHRRVLQSLHPELFIKADRNHIEVNYGKELPRRSKQGAIFTRIDMLPHRVYKYTGTKWFEIDKNLSTTYMSDDYLKFLTDKIQTGEYDIDLLTDIERDYVRDYLLSNLPNSVDKPA